MAAFVFRYKKLNKIRIGLKPHVMIFCIFVNFLLEPYKPLITHIMKKILLFIAAALAVASCKDSKADPDPTPGDKDQISVSPASKTFGNQGGSVDVTVTSSSDWTMTANGSPDWVTASTSVGSDGDVVTFTVSANDTQADKVAEFTFTAGTATAVFKVTSSAGEGGEDPDPIEGRPVINFTDARLFPVGHTWANAEPLRDMSTFTLEAMVYPEVFDKKSNSYESLSTIMGIEGKFLVRFGDSEIENNQLQVAAGDDKVTADMLFDLNKWYHIAVTFNNGAITIYVNGESQASGTSSAVTSVDFGMEHTNEPEGWNSPRCFWIGYAYNTERDFQGQMAEVRIWNKVLSESDLKAEGHFYSVDPASEGLVAYWKMDEGEGTTVKDYTSNGNNLEGQYNLSEDSIGSNTYNGTNVTGESKINWETSTLQ